MYTVNRNTPRRGVILLVVLALLAMFGLVGISFVVITSHERRAAETQQSIGRQSFSPRADANQAILQVLAGTSSGDSVIGPHSLLEDLYGNDSVEGVSVNVLGYQWVSNDSTDPGYPYWQAMKPMFLAGEQILEFTIRDSNPQDFVGRAITFRDGPLAGRTTRIVGLRQAMIDLNGDNLLDPIAWVDTPDPAIFGKSRTPVDPEFPGRPVWKLQVLIPDEFDPSASGTFLGKSFIINGAPFSGTGVGFNPFSTADYSLNAQTSWWDFSGTRNVEQSEDYNGNGILDWGEDVNQNGTLDTDEDTNGNGVLDTEDLNGNGVLDSGPEFALLPNPRTFRQASLFNYSDPNGPGGANEDYDAVDYQNMLLAMVESSGNVPSPSLHRPALINYWFHRMVLNEDSELIPWLDNRVNPGDPVPDWAARWLAVLDPVNYAPNFQIGRAILALKRGFMLGPLLEDHPAHAGTNAARDTYWTTVIRPDLTSAKPTLINTATGAWTGAWYWEAVGPWDVDNDGDGNPDSIWVDLGLPTRETSDGRKYKPMFAILCVDQDGKLNINAHGYTEQYREEYTDAVRDPRGGLVYASDPDPKKLPKLPRGVGCGPPDIDLSPLFKAKSTEYRNLLLGDSKRNGRYGEIQWTLWYQKTPMYHLPAPGRSQTGAALATPFDGTIFNDPLSNNLLHGFAGNYYNSVDDPSNTRTEYGTPVDLKTTMTIGQDLRGQPIYSTSRSVSTSVESSGYVSGWNSDAWDDADANDPYELDLTKGTASGGLYLPASEDAPFTIGEFERVWRPFDMDTASLPDRLVALAPLLNPQTGETTYRRHMTTPASWDLPCPVVGSPMVTVERPATPPTGYPASNRLMEIFRFHLNLDFATKPDSTNYGGINQPPSTQYDNDKELYEWGQGLLARFSLQHVQDILVARIYVESRNQDPISADPVKLLSYARAARSAIEGSLPVLMSTDLLSGLKMDVNRRFGNGEDDDGNGVVDEPQERITLGELSPPEYEKMTLDDVANPVIFDHDNDGWPKDDNSDGTADEHNSANIIDEDTNGNGVLDPGEDQDGDSVIDYNTFDHYSKYRQAYARHLYVLMMALTDHDWYPGASWSSENRAQGIAQWAINVVDFKDRDSIMTPFEYDPTPFTDSDNDGNTWDVDDDITTNDSDTTPHFVWGCERPELLITETLALHDRRTEPPQRGSNLTTWAQLNSPKGSLFIELFNPWTTSEPRPGEFYYDPTKNQWNTGIDLSETAGAGGSPVWRMVIVDPAISQQDPDYPLDPVSPDWTTVPTIERSIYFADISTTPNVLPSRDGQEDGYLRYYSKTASGVLGKNQYAVIGPPGTTVISDPAGGGVLPRQISLTSTLLSVDRNRGADDTMYNQPYTNMRTPVMIVMDTSNPSGERLSVSAPVVDESNIGYRGAVGNNVPPFDANRPDVRDTGTTDGYRVVHLQRLANPLEDYNLVTNPYRTIDSMPIDLTAYTGAADGWPENDPDPYNEPDPTDPMKTIRQPNMENIGINKEIRFHSRQRGEDQEINQGVANNLWKSEPEIRNTNLSTTMDADPTQYFFPFEIDQHSLGYLNEPFGAPRDNTIPGYQGDSSETPCFPWLTWNNRPFVSQLELMMVPATSSSKLLVDYTTATGAPNNYVTSGGSFKHLLNFFQSEENNAGGVPPAHFYRLLEFLHVPSRFAGTQTQLNPTEAAGTTTALSLVGAQHAFHPPFNWASRYREPGPINLNTLFDQTVFTGLMNSPLTTGLPTESDLRNVRRGYSSTGLDQDSPTRFANPFRSFCGLERVPIQNLQTGVGTTLWGIEGLGGGVGTGQAVNATLLRAAGSTNDTFLKFDPGTQSDWNNSDRNPYFRYQALQRLGNLTTTRSSVYAVWITVGYFEVEKVPGENVDRAIYPQGYALGRELGSDTGEIRRHRAFYVIDRSIPVAFKRGQDLNAEKTIVLKRFIE